MGLFSWIRTKMLGRRQGNWCDKCQPQRTWFGYHSNLNRALIRAAEIGHSECVKELTGEAGADVNAKNKDFTARRRAMYSSAN